MKLKIFDAVQKKVAEVGFELAKQKPEILIGVGITAGVVGCICACKATLKADDILKEAKKEVEKIETVSEDYPNEYDDESKKKDLRIVRAKYTVKVVKEYIPAVALGMIAIGCVYQSHMEMKARGAALVAAYNILNEGFKFYRKNVVDEYGEEVDKNLFYGIKSKEIEVTETDEDGNEVTKVESRDVMEKVNPWAFIFSRETSSEWRPEQSYNLNWVRSTEKACQSILDDRAYEMKKKGKDPKKAKFLLSEALERLGMKYTDASCVGGWNGGSIIDFRIKDIYKEAIHEGANQRLLEPAVALNPNCDGVVVHDLPSNHSHLKLIDDYGKDA